MTRQEYTTILDKYSVERPKCKCCNQDIFYDNTIVNISKRWGLKIHGKSYKTIKKVNDIEYHLGVCQDYLLKLFPSIKNLSKTFNVMSKPTQFAFSIPDSVFENSKKKYESSLDHKFKNMD